MDGLKLQWKDWRFFYPLLCFVSALELPEQQNYKIGIGYISQQSLFPCINPHKKEDIDGCQLI